MSDGGNSRSERLRERRSQRSEQAETNKSSKTDESSKPSKTSKLDESSKPSKQTDADTADENEAQSVKDEHIGTYMYIPEGQKKEIERLYNVLKAEYEYEYDTGFEKNRDFYPLLVQYGLDSLDGLDASDVRERLDSI